MALVDSALGGVAGSLVPKAIDQSIQHPKEAIDKSLLFVGRLAGLGASDVEALKHEGVPTWLWMSLGAMGGFAIGVWAASQHPEKLPTWLPGRR